MANRKQMPLALRTKKELKEAKIKIEDLQCDINIINKQNERLSKLLEDKNKLIDELKYSLNSLVEQNSAIWKEHRELKQLVSLAMDNLINKERSRNLSNSVNLQAMNKS